MFSVNVMRFLLMAFFSILPLFYCNDSGSNTSSVTHE